MRTLQFSKRYLLVVTTILVLLLTSCEGLFKDPMKDKETGEDINLLIIDFNFFRTHITVNLFDAATQNRIELPATVTFTGKNGKDIVTYSGQKKPFHEILKGQIELTVDPNVTVTTASPLEFAVTAEVEGYKTMSKTETFLSEGKKNVNVYLAKKSDGTGTQVGGGVDFGNGDTTIVFGIAGKSLLKSAAVAKPFTLKYSLSLNDFLKLKDTQGNLLFNSSQEFWDAYNANKENFLYLHTVTFGNYPSWPDILIIGGTPQNVILNLLETGTVEYMSVGGKKVGSFNGAVMKTVCEWTIGNEPNTWGFAEFSPAGWLYGGKEKNIQALPWQYTLIKASDYSTCSQGASLRFEASFKSSFTITADVFDMQGNRLFAQTFTGNFPATFTLENVPSVPAKLVFRNNNPSFKPIPDLQVSNLCSGNHTVNVLAQDGFIGYQIVLKAFCEKNPAVAVAPTYSGEYRFAGTQNVWQGGFMQGGVLDLLGKPDQEYEYRLLWENEWEVTNFTTTFNADGSYPFASDSKISSEKLSDGRTRINISHTFKQKVCDTMNW